MSDEHRTDPTRDEKTNKNYTIKLVDGTNIVQVRTAMYADDVSFLATGGLLTQAQKDLQNAVSVGSWSKNRKLNSTKTFSTLFYPSELNWKP